ncbi:MAG: glycoside hydrolase family 2 TIM barrel-domain containing protein [Lachnospiraceae bacterium]|nr:glycoside hydrolase family 2 TIM barrel-domain containing protein [Lachnospiraceae bacterium]
MERIYLNDGWKFSEEFDVEMTTLGYLDDGLKEVRIPHTTKELPFHYFDEKEYQMLCGYRRVLYADSTFENKTVLLTFEAVGHDSELFINGVSVHKHHCGYTAFTVDISKYINIGEDNIIAVKVDSRETLNIPPFGFVIDYMTYGGIYREVYIDIKEKSFIDDVFVKTKIKQGGTNSATISEVKLVNAVGGYKVEQYLKKYGEEKYEKLEKEQEVKENQNELSITQYTGGIDLWDINSPNLYELKTVLLDENEKIVDEKTVRFGFRKAVFHKNGFYLNGKKLKLRGLNRHQSYPYVGYAMPESMQKLDADILKYELGLNAVRTSHYPQSHHFLDRCDEIGLLVFTEIPGWQHIGDEDWKNQAVKNVEDMVMQYRNHTSIILWGVRINESVDDDEFYTRTNETARKLDPTRQTGGVRCYKKGSFLEDVYTYNDFSHEGNNAGCDKKASVTSDTNKPYLISEYNGHMFPTKVYDWEEKRTEHAIRHANVIESVAASEDIAGSFGWCMFDYNTHKDFGSGDRICYHGVMDMFRNPKMAAFVYASEQEETPVLELSSTMDIGEHPGCNRHDIYIFTNADSVKMYKNDGFIKEYFSSDSKFKHLKHGPILIDDYIGDAIIKNENMSIGQAKALTDLLNEAARVGLYGLSKIMYLKAAGLVARYHMKMTDAVTLYNKYVGDWGNTSTTYKFEAYKNGKVVKTLVVKPVEKAHIVADIDHSMLTENNTYDVAAVRIKMVDESGNVLPYYNDPIKLKAEGAVELIGPDIMALMGGMGGTYIKTMGETGSGKLTVETISGEKTVVEVVVR